MDAARTSRLRIEALAPAHADVLFDDLREPALYAFIPDDPPASVAALAARYARWCAGAPADRGETWCNWVMLDAADGRPVGTLQATLTAARTATIAYTVVARRQREGLAREGLAWLIDHLAARGVTRLDANVDARNLASIRLLEALGFQRVRTLVAADRFKGAPSDEHVYELHPPLRLRGARCALRDWQPRDLDAYRAWQAPHQSWHDTNGPYLGRPTDEQVARRVAATAADAAMSPSARPVPRTSLAIVDARDELVGHVSWAFESAPTDWRRMGIAVYDPACRGQGIGREALAMWTTYLFASTTARRLDFATYSGNPAMCAVGRALGFTLEARFRQARPWQAEVFDGLVYGVLRDEWDDRPR